MEKFIELIKNFNSVYLAGGIQGRHRQDWRTDLQKFFELNGKVVYNPVKDNENIFNPSILGFKSKDEPYDLSELQDVDELKETVILKQTEMNDYQMISWSDLIIFYLDETAGFGTFTEFKWCYDEFRKPIIIVRNISRRKLPHWIKWRRYCYLIIEKRAIEFRNFQELKEFFKEHFSFKDR